MVGRRDGEETRSFVLTAGMHRLRSFVRSYVRTYVRLLLCNISRYVITTHTHGCWILDGGDASRSAYETEKKIPRDIPRLKEREKKETSRKKQKRKGGKKKRKHARECTLLLKNSNSGGREPFNFQFRGSIWSASSLGSHRPGFPSLGLSYYRR